MNSVLLVIDPQNDFCTPEERGNKGSLLVPGAPEDMQRLAKWMLQTQLAGLMITLDYHNPKGSIDQPEWWTHAITGEHPKPFTALELRDGRIMAVGTEDEYRCYMDTWGHTYLKALAARGKTHMVWPVHCRMDSWGAMTTRYLRSAVEEVAFRTSTRYVFKGLNSQVEQFSAVRAEVPVLCDPGTLPNMEMLEFLSTFHKIYVAGEALSHCIRATLEDIAYLTPQLVPKLVLLENATSVIPGFEATTQEFVDRMVAMGMTKERICEL